MKRFLWGILCLAVCLTCRAACRPAASAETARDLAPECDITATEHPERKRYMLDRNLARFWDGGEAGALEVRLPKGEKAQGIVVTYHGCNAAAQVTDAAGTVIGRSEGRYRVDWIPFDVETDHFILKRAQPGTAFQINRLQVLSAGDMPDWVQRWQSLEQPAELLLVATHPDDEILWFGGILPYYAGQLKRRVMVAYMVGGRNSIRTIELLDGLWTMGVRYYPDIGDLPDSGLGSAGSTYLAWGRGTALDRVVTLIRRYRPEVVITQDVKGEYGHGGHIVTVQAVIDAVRTHAGDAAYQPEGEAAYEPWTPYKLYIHLWKENVIRFDWQQPLSAFGGKTGLEIARAAFKKHVSQQHGKHQYAVRDSGQYDCSIFGLYYSAVGLDERRDDLFEHVPSGQPVISPID